jgi:ATP phosphoribosyltransferase regulatory subunit
MLARALAPAITGENLPLRVFYRGDVIRCDASRLGATREMFQIGAEIVGDESIEADLAVLRLSAALIREFGLEPTVVYSDAAIAEALIAGSSAVRTALAMKRMHADVPYALRTVTEKLIAGVATLDDVRPFAPAAISRLESISLALADDCFVLHLDDLDDGAGYYSGLRFRVYAGASRTKLAQGGRYDRLYERFGTPAAAVGFTFTIDDLD